MLIQWRSSIVWFPKDVAGPLSWSMLNDLLVFVISISVLCCCCTCGRGSYSRMAALQVIILLHNALPNGVHVQGSAIGWALGCVNPASWLPLAMGASSRNLGTTLLPSPVYEPWIPVHLWIAFFGISDVELHSLFHSCHLPIMSENFPYDQDAANDIYEEWQSYRDVEPYEPASFVCNNRPKHE